MLENHSALPEPEEKSEENLKGSNPENKKSIPDVRQMLGTDSSFSVFRAGKRTRFSRIVSLLAFIGLIAIITSLLNLKTDNDYTGNSIEEDCFIAKKTLDITAEIEQKYFHNHGRYAEIDELIIKYPVMKKHLDNLSRRGFILKLTKNEKSCNITIEPSAKSSHGNSFCITLNHD